MIFLFVKHVSTYSNPQDRSRTDLGSQPHCAVPPVMPALPHNAVFSRLSSEVISLVQPLTANRQHEEEVKRIIRPSLIFSFILSQERTKVKSKSFVSENLCEKLLPTFSSATFRIFLGHRCILNLPYVLRIRVLICRSPSHQPSAWDHSLSCRWLGESSPITLYCQLVNRYTIDQSLIEVNVFLRVSTTSLSQGNFSSLSQSLNYIIAKLHHMSSIFLCLHLYSAFADSDDQSLLNRLVPTFAKIPCLKPT